MIKTEKYQIPKEKLYKFNLNFGLKFTGNRIQTKQNPKKYNINGSEVERYEKYLKIKGDEENNKNTLNTIEKLTEVKLI